MPSAFALSLSPTSITETNALPGDDTQITFLANKELQLLNSTCDGVDISLTANILEIEVPTTSVAKIISCFITLSFANTTSVTYALPVLLKINSTLVSNISVQYDDKSLTLVNNGNGTGQLWFCDETGHQKFNVEPTKDVELTPSGAIRVGSGENCIPELFSHTFSENNVMRNRNIAATGGTGENYFKKYIWWFVCAAILLFLLLIALACLARGQFTRRNRTLVKNTS